MSLLQDPINALNQIEWYLDNQSQEKFPGAFLISAGNLCRQVVEQVQFILAFYSGMPRSNYMKANLQLKTANLVWNALRDVNPSSGKTYFEEARRRGPRIKKFARFPHSLNKWRREFNEPSHFRNPAAKRKTREKHISAFVKRMRPLFDQVDPYLITAAFNEIVSKGKVKAVLGSDLNNTPGVRVDIILKASALFIDERILRWRTPTFPIRVVPDDKEVPYKSSSAVVLVQHSYGMMLNMHLRAEDGLPIDLTNTETVILSMARTLEGRKRVERRLNKLGIEIDWNIK